jgi:hypothetical protein
VKDPLRGIRPGEAAGLMFIGIGVGLVIGSFLIAFFVVSRLTELVLAFFS